MLDALRRFFELVLEYFVILLMVVLTTIVIVAVVYRLLGSSLAWYDEVAAILLAWITYYGSALAALRRRHIGFDTVLLAIPMPARMVAVAVAEAVTAAFFILLAWAGWTVMMILGGMSLVSLTWMPVSVTQSVIPIGAILFLICQALSLPGYWVTTARGVSLEHAEIEEEVETEMKKAGNA
ncbi:TRAP transporter small permease [Jannaschia aquimarina]|uniref:TRAP transporter small permease protein n=1 Tax=Jannaschia aquimarina TaxID=935700 RepID=A0A0D1EGW7_9RHOB|nr:TRAP transporter small permease subunit [Jannaschia aquimarina]KIT16864.1 Tripartite ATP-independent periplasmic transporter, DctQ component [Jannaschia aquimarina]SNT12789.1 TRAP-type C4-dicarboxylate transport system, small permease component [Jannaschia aquimarina]